MELAKLVLEYLKALAWPLIVLFLVLRFRASIVRILNAVGDRLASAETVKVGVFGQEVEISGTAKELQVVRQDLLANSSEDQEAQERAGRIQKAIPQLNKPMADIVGVALLNTPRGGLTADDLVETVLNTLSSKGDRGRFRAESAQFLLISMAREVEKVLAQLVELDFVMAKGERYSLTTAGQEFFEKVAVRQQHLLSRFAARTSNS
jgi:hypothetical protein